ncbi:hypothetical protein [Bradyrhizobium valentinum]|uniref:Uncharacterized protein n=1 Tax=Bradyrhizobium valentinum TaxID=1518501 RepID=A0A0R3M394_9BRAD|nr:hypothetical protein [Bradyrhizobium valentinum]KRR03128.1 hypothetical protein CP49_04055 [Bradyrhizobium valentinum]KRR14062.1 hypothetical protein CQ10_09640 [Bradyrhizobium valentinum]
MFVWIVILILWIALIALILHDATKQSSDGSAVVLAAKKINLWIRRKARQSRKTSRHRNAKKASAKPPMEVEEPAVSAVATSPEVVPQEEPAPEKQPLGRPKKRKWWRNDSRTEITVPELEAAISEAVKKTAPCEDFVGVIVGRKTPKSNLDPNWEIQGAKFGKADRKLAAETLANVVQRMQKELVLVEERSVTRQRAAGWASL